MEDIQVEGNPGAKSSLQQAPALLPSKGPHWGEGWLRWQWDTVWCGDGWLVLCFL